MDNMVRTSYFGIDLGTTNSVVSWSTTNHRGEIVTEVLNMDMQDITGNIKAQLLPSYIYLDEKNIPTIGRKAKSMISRQPDRVIKNAKSFMGSGRKFKIGNKEISPVEASAMILKYIGKAVEKQFGEYPNNVVITVPASFDSDKRVDTLKAAELAGFKTKDKDGNSIEVLLSEPRAALYDYVNLQNNNMIPSTIDFRSNKNILVFDLGGGTLDVSVHSLKYGDHGNLDIKDLGVSRFTEVGGSNFDKLVGDFLLNEFLEKNKIKDLDTFDTNFLNDVFTEYAEEIKLDLNNQVENERTFGFGGTDLNEIESEIYKTAVFRGLNFKYTMSMDKYKEIVKSLLAVDMTVEDLSNIDNITESENIIYPILDAMKKAEEKIGDKLSIDAIILNGGMTKFYPIEERVEKFFSKKPHSVLDQDKSVARGASVFNFRTSTGEKFEKILNDTIGIERTGGVVHHLVEAGSVLPIRKKIDDFVIPSDQIRVFDLPFYLGRREDTKLPNRKIADRRICLDKPMNRGEVVSMEIVVNEMGIMEIQGSAGYDNQKFTVKVETSGKVESFRNEEIVTTPKEKVKFVPTGKAVDVNLRIKEYIGKCEAFDKANSEGPKRAAMARIKEIESEVAIATNGLDFIRELLKHNGKLTGTGKDRATLQYGDFGKKYPEICDDVFRIFMKNISLDNLITVVGARATRSLNGYIRFSIEGLRKIDRKLDSEDKLVDLLNNGLLAPISSSLQMTIGSICTGDRALRALEKSLDGEFNECTFWGLGKFGSRERDVIVPIYKLEGIAHKIASTLPNLTTRELLRNAIYALAEICDRRGNGEIISRESGDRIIKAINSVTMSDSVITKIKEVAIAVISGEKLTVTQSRILLDLRVLL